MRVTYFSVYIDTFHNLGACQTGGGGNIYWDAIGSAASGSTPRPVSRQRGKVRWQGPPASTASKVGRLEGHRCRPFLPSWHSGPPTSLEDSAGLLEFGGCSAKLRKLLRRCYGPADTLPTPPVRQPDTCRPRAGRPPSPYA